MLEKTTKRLDMIDQLVRMIKETPNDLIKKVAYLTQSKIYPDFLGIELGIAEQIAIISISKATNTSRSEVKKMWKEIGDLGEVAEKLLTKRKVRTLLEEPEVLTVEEVYSKLDYIARIRGKGAVESKIDQLTKLIVKATPKEAKYLIRTATGRLRLGVGDMTFLDALAIAYGKGKHSRENIEHAYNISSDLGFVSEVLAERGLQGITEIEMTIGHPVRPMLCERLVSAEEILEKLGGKGAAEFKYDGLRIQAHISPKEIFLFSRRLENITKQFPDIVRDLRKNIYSKSAILEGECVAVDPDTGEMLPFQVVTKRRGRKYQIDKKIVEVPVVFIIFDILYLEQKSLLGYPYLDRRGILEKTVIDIDNIQLAYHKILNTSDELNEFMEKAIEAGCEGLVVKSISSKSIYQPGSRGFLWIKYKREQISELADTIDLVAIGAFAGRGKRAGTYGALLMAAYDDESDSFKTVCKLGTGFDDETLIKLPTIFREDRIDNIHPQVDSKIEADYWFTPNKILEIRGSELTLSPSHTCGLDSIKKNSGLAVRFPRFTGKWREDKAPNDATTVKEIIAMYKAQLKKIKK